MKYGCEISIFPTQLFEAFSMPLLLAVTLFMLYKNRKYSYFAFIIGFSAVIFVSEFFMFRHDYERTLLGLSMPQVCALALALYEILKKTGLKLKASAE